MKGKRHYPSEQDDLQAPMRNGWKRETTIRLVFVFISPLLKMHFQGVHKVWYKRRGRWSCSPWKDVQATSWHNQIPFKTNRTGVGVFLLLTIYIRCLPTFTVMLAWGRKGTSATVKIGWRRKYIRYASVCVLSRFIIYFI